MNKILGLIGIARKANLISLGVENVENSIRNKRAKIVILAHDTKENSKKSVINCCTFYSVEYIFYSNKQQLGIATGGSDVAVLSINDEKLAETLKNRIENSSEEGES